MGNINLSLATYTKQLIMSKQILLFVYFLCVQIYISNGEQLIGIKNITQTMNGDFNTLNLEPSDKTLLFHDTSFPAAKFETDLTLNTKSTGNNNKGSLVPFKVELFQKFNPTNIVKPVQEKLMKVKESLALPYNPAYGGVQSWSPEQIWQKIHETGHNFITGINGAIFGLIHPPNHDYPFPYRTSNQS